MFDPDTKHRLLQMTAKDRRSQAPPSRRLLARRNRLLARLDALVQVLGPTPG